MTSRGKAVAIAVATVLLASVGVLGAKAWSFTTADRQRLESMQQAPAQPAHREAIEDERHYPIDMRPFADLVESATFADPPFDDDGIVHVEYPPAPPSRETTTFEHNPVTAAQYALGCWERYLHGEGDAEPFLRHAEWLRDRMDADGRLEYEFDVPSHRLEEPWVSGMAQGQAISVFVRAAEYTGDEKWLDAARTALKPLQVDVSDGGTLSERDGQVWFEEYPETPPGHVFNGHVFAVFGIRDLANATNDPRAEEMWRKGAATLAGALSDFEHDGWLLYDLGKRDIAMRQYYRIQVDQTALLGEMTGDERFENAVARWDDPIESPNAWLAKRLLVRGVELIERHLPW